MASSVKYTNTDPSLPIHFEDDHMLIVQKPPGLLSQGDYTGDPDIYSLCRQYVSKEQDKRPQLGLLHRLDRPVSGLMVLGKNKKASRELSRQIKQGKLQKSYCAVVHGRPKINGVLTHYLVKDHSTNTVSVISHKNHNSQYAELAYQRLKSSDNLSLLKIHLQTGRSHQIRVQLSHEGYPIWGDKKYGKDSRKEDTRPIALLAQHMMLFHPENREELQFTLPLPDHYPWNIFDH